MLEVVEITKRYAEITAVDRVSFAIKPYEVVGYLGPNGSGKTTTVNMLTGLLRPSSGEIRLDGVKIEQNRKDYKRRIGYVPEEPALYPYLNAIEYLELVGRLRLLPEAPIRRRTEDLLALLGLHPHRFTPLSSYSKGMKQKVLVAAALLHDPDILFLDEPFSGLDVESALVLRRLIELLGQKGKMILFSSHVLEIVERVCSRVIILSGGRVVADDSIARLRELSRKPSLEAVFAQLAVHQDIDEVASGILDTIST